LLRNVLITGMTGLGGSGKAAGAQEIGILPGITTREVEDQVRRQAGL
jgi:hypothetical protein